MTLWQFLSENFIWLAIIVGLFGSSIGAGLRWLVKTLVAHRERMAKERTRQLELSLQIAQTPVGVKDERWGTPPPLIGGDDYAAGYRAGRAPAASDPQLMYEIKKERDL